MASPFRPMLAVLAIFALGLSLSACSSTPDEPMAVAAPANTAISDSDTLTATFVATNNQAEVERTVNDARRGGQSDEQIAEALGKAYLRAPRRRVMFSVNFIHFREASATEASVLDAAYEYGRTPPAVREAEAAAAEAAAAAAAAPIVEEADEEEEEEPRQSGWRRWVPGF